MADYIEEAERQISFFDKIEQLFIDEMDRRATKLVTDEFVNVLLSEDWERGTIRDLLAILRSKEKDSDSMDLLIMYLFAELVNERKITFSWTPEGVDKDEEDCGEPFCTGEGTEISLFVDQGVMAAKLVPANRRQTNGN